MLVRRIATVTISAPAASVARRVSSRSLNLPVPVSRREAIGLAGDDERVVPAIIADYSWRYRSEKRRKVFVGGPGGPMRRRVGIYAAGAAPMIGPLIAEAGRPD
jgi:hypothetical protein